jgi:hypothetical protein
LLVDAGAQKRHDRTMRGLVFGALVVAACARTWTGQATQPNPAASATETLRTSERITIKVGDMDLEEPDQAEGPGDAHYARMHHYYLQNAASFTMVSRDRLRFHVQIDHKWDEYADLNTWKADLVDDRGRHWLPESIEHAKRKLLTRMWDKQSRAAICDPRYGRTGTGDCFNTIGFKNEGADSDAIVDGNTIKPERTPLGNLSVFRGTADLVFYDRDMFDASVRSLTLKLSRSGETFEFTWNFDDAVAEN